MASVSVIKLKVRRGSDADRKQIILDPGEIGYTVDTHRIFVGNGIQYGGLSVALGFYTTATFPGLSGSGIQTNDLVFNTSTQSLYALTGTDLSTASSYIKLVDINKLNGTTLPTVSGAPGSGTLWRDANGFVRTTL